MTVTTEPEFYDTAMCSKHEPAMIPLELSPWRELYQQASWLISPTHPVVDLGCGTGRFAEQLRRRGHARYHGLDFSPAAVAECERYVPEHDRETDWHAHFDIVDLRQWRPDSGRPGTTVYVCLETLEHLEDDVELVRRVPVGHEFVFSVPNHSSIAHLRWFQQPSEVWERYGLLLEFRSWMLIGEGPRNYIHLFRTRRRVDAW